MYKILVIEDNQMMRLFLVNYLGNDHDVSAVESPSEALVWLASNSASLIISDYHKKDSTDFNQLKKVQSLSAWNNVPMIMLTDNDKSDQRIDALEFGVADSMSKPFNPVELNLRVHAVKKQSQIKFSYKTAS
jgi:DNA-binding response OmpR family regulator